MLHTYFRSVGALLTACLASPVWAVSILPGVDFIRSIERQAEAVYRSGGVVFKEDTDVGSGAVSAAIKADPVMALRAPGEDYMAGGYASGVIGTTGISVVQSAAQLTGSIAPGPQHILRAEVTETVTGVIPTTGSYDVQFQFDLFDMVFETWDTSFPGIDTREDSVVQQAFYEVSLNGVQAYSLNVVVEGGRLLDPLSIGWDERRFGGIEPDPPLTYTEIGGVGEVPRRVVFDSFSQPYFSLGTIMPSIPGVEELFEVEIEMSAILYIPSDILDSGGGVSIGDPNAFARRYDSLRLVESDAQGKTPVPTPTAAWLLSIGLGAFAVRRRNGRYPIHPEN